MTKNEALALALDVLVEMSPSGATGSDIWQKQMSAITTIATALAQPPLPVQEPDALTIAYQSGFYDGKKAAQRPWVGLTEKEAKSFIGFYKMDIARLVEAKLKEKNS